LTLDTLWVSPSLRQAVEEHPRLTIEEEVPLAFSLSGTMHSPWALSDVELPVNGTSAVAQQNGSQSVGQPTEERQNV
jgi:hypothetical protein